MVTQNHFLVAANVPEISERDEGWDDVRPWQSETLRGAEDTATSVHMFALRCLGRRQRRIELAYDKREPVLRDGACDSAGPDIDKGLVKLRHVYARGLCVDDGGLFAIVSRGESEERRRQRDLLRLLCDLGVMSDSAIPTALARSIAARGIVVVVFLKLLNDVPVAKLGLVLAEGDISNFARASGRKLAAKVASKRRTGGALRRRQGIWNYGRDRGPLD
ncbi:hypothetical protein K503DRAFT_835979 [Rhizopogon vinicolor AM-OR11-026]|uniref:Uncharacterized protein n=1 Tax=Rhizopogon vinicolor AM-OR11-026 TaxID=1314800 RepID=A0A1B7MMT4_9AGAM|nr:hypothetical protein K503DRAFT_835979 [Rhizopogon vinicolor AM-OR11-026]